MVNIFDWNYIIEIIQNNQNNRIVPQCIFNKYSTTIVLYCIVSLLTAHGGAKSYEYKFSFLASIEQQTNRK